MDNQNFDNFIDKMPRKEWFLDLKEYTIITKDILDMFEYNEDEIVFVEKLKRLKIPFDTINKMDKRMWMYNNVNTELKLKPNKNQWHIIKTKNLKKGLFLTGGTRMNSELRKYYLDLEDVFRNYISKSNDNKKVYEIVDIAIEKALKRYTQIIDDKIISNLSS